MATRIGINGFGRMGRLAFRAGWGNPEIEFAHLNEIGGDGATSAHLLYFDSLHGRWNREVYGEKDKLVIEGKTVTHSSQKNFADVPWRDLGVDIVLESSGKFRTQEQLDLYLKAGVKKVIVAAPVEETLEDSFCAELVGQEHHGMAFGTLATVNGVGDFVSSVVVGLLWTALGVQAAFAYSAILFALGSWLVWRLARTPG